MPSAQILTLCRERKARIRARLAPAFAGRLVNRLRDVAIGVEKLPQLSSRPCRSRTGLLVTVDKPLLGLKRHKSTRIVTPATLLELLRGSGAQMMELQ